MTEQGRQRAWQAGSLGWCGYDYYTNRQNLGIKYSGAFDIMRIRKFCSYFYQSQSAADNYDGTVHPMVHIASYNRPDSPLDRKVYSNCDQVKLYQNGVLVATQAPDAGRTLAHPPFTFKNVAYAAGTLRAEGLIGGVVVARDSVKSPLTASALRLIADPDTIEANGGDFSRVEAYIIDANGTWVQYIKNPITFSISGAGDLVGDNPLAAQSGACITLAKARLTPGTLTVTASATGLASATATIVVKGVTTGILPALRPALHSMPASVKVVKAIGSKLTIPAGPGALRWVTIYDLMGNSLYKKKTDQRTIDLRKEIGKAEGAYFVKVSAIQ
jgi:beta-galactosidase